MCPTQNTTAPPQNNKFIYYNDRIVDTENRRKEGKMPTTTPNYSERKWRPYALHLKCKDDEKIFYLCPYRSF
jgi:hypothetical protein